MQGQVSPSTGSIWIPDWKRETGKRGFDLKEQPSGPFWGSGWRLHGASVILEFTFTFLVLVLPVIWLHCWLECNRSGLCPPSALGLRGVRASDTFWQWRWHVVSALKRRSRTQFCDNMPSRKASAEGPWHTAQTVPQDTGECFLRPQYQAPPQTCETKVTVGAGDSQMTLKIRLRCAHPVLVLPSNIRSSFAGSGETGKCKLPSLYQTY